MKNNFFVYVLTAFCLFSLQTINTSKGDQLLTPAQRREIEHDERKGRLMAAIMNNYASIIEEILKGYPLIVGEMVPYLTSNPNFTNRDFTFRDLLIFYRNPRGIEIINKILDTNPSLATDLYGKFHPDFKSIPLDSIVGNLSSGDLELDACMLNAARNWNLHLADSFGENGQADALLTDVDKLKASKYERMVIKVFAGLLSTNDQNVLNTLPWVAEHIPALQRANGELLDEQFVSGLKMSDDIPRIVLRDKINEEHSQTLKAWLKNGQLEAFVKNVNAKNALRMAEAQQRISDFCDKSLPLPYLKRIE